MNYFLYGTTLLLLILSYFQNRKKTKMGLRKALKAFENILPQFLGVIVLVGLLLSVFDADIISKMIGEKSGVLGVIFSGIIGAITLIPGFIAFPTAAILLKNGAGYTQIAAFISALMMVGIITLPIEMKYFGKRFAIFRNIIGFIFSFIVAYLIGVVI